MVIRQAETSYSLVSLYKETSLTFQARTTSLSCKHSPFPSQEKQAQLLFQADHSPNTMLFNAQALTMLAMLATTVLATHKIGDPCTNKEYYGTRGCSSGQCKVVSRRPLSKVLSRSLTNLGGQMCAGAARRRTALLEGSPGVPRHAVSEWGVRQGFPR